ncbi:hypothetical protein MMPV_008033 [Pyropia vietnamensis]
MRLATRRDTPVAGATAGAMAPRRRLPTVGVVALTSPPIVPVTPPRARRQRVRRPPTAAPPWTSTRARTRTAVAVAAAALAVVSLVAVATATATGGATAGAGVPHRGVHVEVAAWDDAAVLSSVLPAGAVGGANHSAAVAALPPDVAAYREAYLGTVARRASSASALRAAAAKSGSVPSGALTLASRLATAVGFGRWRHGLAGGLNADAVAAADPPAVVLKPLARQMVTTVRGSRSSFRLELDESLPPAETRAIIRAVQLWAEEWPSSGTLRVQVLWQRLDPDALGATSTPLFIEGGRSPTREDTAYGAPLYLSLTGVDALPERFPHVLMGFNNRIPWHTGVGPAPRSRFDLTTVAAHELCHGLFFAGMLEGLPTERVARVNSRRGGDPARFDSFVTDSEGNGVLASCVDGGSLNGRGLFNALTAEGLAFQSPLGRRTAGGSGGSGDSQLITSLPLFAPKGYRTGSSTYHFDGGRQLVAGCARSGIPEDPGSCSDLMVADLPPGKTTRVLGANTLRVMRTMRDQALSGADRGSCTIPQSAPGSAGGGGGAIDEPFLPGTGGGGGGGPFSGFPTWAMILVATVGAVGVLVFVGAFCANLVLPGIQSAGGRAHGGGRSSTGRHRSGHSHHGRGGAAPPPTMPPRPPMPLAAAGPPQFPPYASGGAPGSPGAAYPPPLYPQPPPPVAVGAPGGVGGMYNP